MNWGEGFNPPPNPASIDLAARRQLFGARYKHLMYLLCRNCRCNVCCRLSNCSRTLN